MVAIAARQAAGSEFVRWQAPATFDAEATAEIKASRLITPYQGEAMAVQNEERAFAFWSYMAASAKALTSRALPKQWRAKNSGMSPLSDESVAGPIIESAHTRAARRGCAVLGSAESRVNARILELQLAAYLEGLTHRSSGAVGSRLRELREETLLMA